jgi:hypothetical protein
VNDVAEFPPSVPWRKSRRSSNNAACVEIAHLNGTFGVRDSKNIHGSVIVLSEVGFTAFLRSVQV